jgi:hypothetical protein
MKSNSTAFLIKIKLRHSLGRPSRSDFVQSEVAKENNENYLTDEEQHKIIIKDYDMLFEYRE